MLDLLEAHELDLLSKKYLSAIYAKGYSNIPNLSIDEVRSIHTKVATKVATT